MLYRYVIGPYKFCDWLINCQAFSKLTMTVNVMGCSDENYCNYMMHDDNDDDVNNDDGDDHEIYLRLVKQRFCYVYAEKSNY